MVSDLNVEAWATLAASHRDLACMPLTLRSSARVVAVSDGAVIARLGNRPRRMLFVIEGELQLLRHARNGAQIILQRAPRGFVAEASLESARYHCDIVAARPSKFIAFPGEIFRQALKTDEAFRHFWITRLAREVRTLRAQCERLSLRSAADRIEHYIEAEGTDGRLQLMQTRKVWAAELGLTHEALYRTLSTMVRTGRLSMQGEGAGLILRIGRSPRDHERARTSTRSASE